MTRFTDRVKRDLSQISDRATPSSTAWEAIQHRIDEQDTNEPTMEVIMLAPDTNTLLKRPRTPLLLAAAAAAVALVGGLIVVTNRDGAPAPADRTNTTVPVTEPAIGGDPATAEPTPVVVDPELAPAPDQPTDVAIADGDALPPVESPSQGLIAPECSYEFAGEDVVNNRDILTQACTSDADETPPYAVEQTYELSILKNFTNGSDSPFVALGDDGAMMAGISFNNSETQRFIGIAEGKAGTDYAERPVYFAGRGQNDPTSTDGSDIGEGEWWTEDGARPVFGGIEVTVEVEVVCLTVELEAPASGTATDCSYSGPDADRFLPSEERQTSQIIPPGFGDPTAAANSVFGSSFVVSLSEDGTVLRSGIVDGGTDFRWSGLRPGVGEFEGMSISENGWVRFDDPGSETSTARGVIQLTVLPADV